MGFQLDGQNFIAGLLAGWASAYAVYRSRDTLASWRAALRRRATTAQEFAGGRTENRYIDHLIQSIQRDHLFGQQVELGKVLIEPRFIAREAFAEPPDEDRIYDVFRVVPRIHDLPYLYAPYNISSASVYDLGFGDRAIALLGLPGSGRTTALYSIALWALGRLSFKPEDDPVTLQLREEEKSLSASERAAREKERRMIEERARERLATEQGMKLDAVGTGAVSPLRGLLPVYVHLGNVTPTRDEFGADADPAEPFIRAVQYEVGGGALAKTLPRRFYDLLKNGQMLVLLDGYDDLPALEQPRIAAWLKAFVATYRHNFIIVAGCATGYGRLAQAGLTPVYLRAPSDVQAERQAEALAAHWGAISGARGRDAQPADPEIVRELKADLRALSPLDIALKARAFYARQATDDDTTPARMMALYLAGRDLPAEVTARLPEIAALQLDEGFITHARLCDLARGRRSAPLAVSDAALDAAFSPSPDDDLDALFGDDSGESERVAPVAAPASPAASAGEPALDKKQAAALEKAQAHLLRTLTKAGILRAYRGGRYLFAHPLIAAYYASQSLHTAPDDLLIEKALLPAWDHALAYLNATHNTDVAVSARFRQPPDALYNHLLGVARWLAHCPAAPTWKPELIKQLGTLFIAPNQYPHLRERIAAALVGSRDKGALVIFRRGLENPNPDVRRLSCLAVGALREPKAVAFISPLLRDKDEEVRLAAGVALGSIGTDEAFDLMITVLTTENEHLRHVIAETFAALPQEGYPILHEAISSDDMMLRRAAVFGLRRINAPWALGEIYRVFIQDSQWYVRSAAQQVFQEIQTNDASRGLRAYPPLEAVGWVREWLASAGERAAQINPEEALTEILQDNDPVLKATSVQALAQLGKADQLIYVYDTLLQEDETVRAAAQKALCDLQMQMGESVPAPA